MTAMVASREVLLVVVRPLLGVNGANAEAPAMRQERCSKFWQRMLICVKKIVLFV